MSQRTPPQALTSAAPAPASEPAKEKARPYTQKSAETGAVRLFLKHPVLYAGETFGELTFRRPKGKWMRGMNSEETIDQILDFAARLSGQVPMLIDEVEGEDLEVMLEVVGSFFTRGRRAGK